MKDKLDIYYFKIEIDKDCDPWKIACVTTQSKINDDEWMQIFSALRQFAFLMGLGFLFKDSHEINH